MLAYGLALLKAPFDVFVPHQFSIIKPFPQKFVGGPLNSSPPTKADLAHGDIAGLHV